MNDDKVTQSGLFRGEWQERLSFVVDMMREMSAQVDPQKMVQNYGGRMSEVLPADGFVALSRRGLNRPQVRVTRSHLWGEDVNPWTAKQHTILNGGMLAQLIWDERAVVLHDFTIEPGDPSAPFLASMRSLIAIPLFDAGKSLNMVVRLKQTTQGFSTEHLPEHVWISNLFGRATQNLKLSDELKRAYELVDREMKIVADMQRSLLPRRLPDIPGLKVATHYQTSRRAGGDYYDFFELPGGLWGIFIADVSGHGTPAAVMMAVTHSIAHTHIGPPVPPSVLMTFINGHLTARYTTDTGTFVTAFYGIYDPRTRKLTYSCAGHCPPRVKLAGRKGGGHIVALEGALALPLGIDPDETYIDETTTLNIGDALILYTDGITEARKPNSSDMFGVPRLDDVLDACDCDPETIVRNTMLAVEEFTDSSAPTDDMTVLVAKVV